MQDGVPFRRLTAGLPVPGTRAHADSPCRVLQTVLVISCSSHLPIPRRREGLDRASPMVALAMTPHTTLGSAQSALRVRSDSDGTEQDRRHARLLINLPLT